MGSLEFESVFKPVAIILTIYFCFADRLVGKVIGEAICGCLISFVISGIIVWLSGFAVAVTPYIAAAIVVALGVYFYHKCLGSNLKEQENDDLLNPKFEHLELEPLYEAYHPSPDGFDSSIGDRTDEYQKELSSIKKTMWAKAVPIGIITVIGILYFLIFSSSSKPDFSSTSSSNSHSVEQTIPDFHNGLFGTWVGRLDGKNIQIEFEQSDSPQDFSFSMSEIGDTSSKIIFSGSFNPSLKELQIRKCRIPSDITVNIKGTGTLRLNEDKIIGDIEIINPQNGTATVSIAINVQYVPE